MRIVMLLGWLLVPVLAGAYHYGPGQQRLVEDEAAAILREADALAAQEDWAAAAERYDDALKVVPEERVGEARAVRLERAKARLNAGRMPEAYADLQALVDETAGDESVDPKLRDDAQATLANCRYYLTWLMRLEGRPREEWEPEIEAARQTFRLLAEQHDSSAGADARRRQEDLESTIRLARMDLSELQALSLPSQCQGCCSGDCKGSGSGKGKRPGKGRGKGERTGDEFARGASSGPPPDGRGS
ncbi:MAG: hypothetical protein WD066_19315 [Planctomycetaceae bacterium]